MRVTVATFTGDRSALDDLDGPASDQRINLTPRGHAVLMLLDLEAARLAAVAAGPVSLLHDLLAKR